MTEDSEEEKYKKELEDFVYIVSHDITAPVRIITAYAEMLAKNLSDGRLTEKEQGYINNISKARDTYSTLITAINDYSRLSTRQKIGEKPVNSAEIIETVIGQFKNSLSNNNIKITTEDGEYPYLEGDAGQIHQLFWEIIDNAIKFRKKEGDTKINISVTKPADTHVFCIEDNGIGINKKFHDKIFRMFRKLHSEQDYSGKGAGLAMAKKIIDLNKGQLWVESEEDIGTKLYFSLPTHK